MNSKTHLKRIYVIHCIITDPITNTINDSSLIATEDSKVADYLIKTMIKELKISVADLATKMIHLHCNIPAYLQDSDHRNILCKGDIEFYKTSVLLSDIRRD